MVCFSVCCCLIVLATLLFVNVTAYVTFLPDQSFNTVEYMIAVTVRSVGQQVLLPTTTTVCMSMFNASHSYVKNICLYT